MHTKHQGNGLLIFVVIIGLIVIAYFIFQKNTVEAPTETESSSETTQQPETTRTQTAQTQNQDTVRTLETTELETLEQDITFIEQDIEDLRFEDLGLE